MPLSPTSEAFKQNGIIPSEYTCEGRDISIPLRWDGVPEGAKSLALIVDDPDAPDSEAPKMVFCHWLVYNIPPETRSLPEDASPDGLPEGAREGRNDFKRTRFGGPCPPKGRHRYFHKLYALDTMLEGLDSPDKAALEAAMEGHILDRAELIGTYQKGDGSPPSPDKPETPRGHGFGMK